MVKATKVTKTVKAARSPKAVRSPEKKAATRPAAKPAGKKLKTASLDEMFRAAVASNESFKATEDDYDRAVDHFNGVIKLLDAIIAIDPAYRDALNYKGMMLYGCGQAASALACFESIIKSNPADKEALNNKGICLYGLGRDADALKCVEAAIAIDRRYADAYMNKAVILHGLGRLEEADKAVRMAKALDMVTG